MKLIIIISLILKKNKIIDCFLLYDELDLLKFRLTELFNVVDYFFILESDHDFKNSPKELFFKKKDISLSIEHFEHFFISYVILILYIKDISSHSTISGINPLIEVGFCNRFVQLFPTFDLVIDWIYPNLSF